MSSKKIAVVFAGHPRLFEKCYKSHLEFFNLDGYEFDFFIHAWNDQWYNPYTKSNTTVDNPQTVDIDKLRDRLSEIYLPKDIIVESQLSCDNLINNVKLMIELQRACNNLQMDSSVETWLEETHAGQLYSWQQACNLKTKYQQTHNVKYDACIKFRLDNILSKYNNSQKDIIFRKFCNTIHGGVPDHPDAKFNRDIMYFTWQSKYNSNVSSWSVGDMIFGGPQKYFDMLLDDMFLFWTRTYAHMISNSAGTWECLYNSESMLGRKIVHNNIKTHTVNIRQIPYRDYHLTNPDQSFNSLNKQRMEYELYPFICSQHDSA